MKLIQDAGLTNRSNGEDTPANSIFHADMDGPPWRDSWNYCSIKGKLNYLANNTRPDISMAVHQCARFSCAPRALHELAIKRIIRYLSTTATKGLTMQPSTHLMLDMYVDSDFAGMWHKEHSHHRDNVLSCTGYIILFSTCPTSSSDTSGH
jgi:hypothetical protein